jgi:hypothetical protein
VNFTDEESDKLQVIHEYDENGKALYLDTSIADSYVLIGDVQTEEPRWEKYDGDAYIDVADVTAHAGGYVDVPVYMAFGDDVMPNYIYEAEFKAEYDKEALELIDIIRPKEAGISRGIFDCSVQNDTFVYYSVGKNNRLAVIPERAMAILRFKVNEDAFGEYDVTIGSIISADDYPVIIHDVDPDGDTTYLRPIVDGGIVLVDDEEPEDIELPVIEPEFIGIAEIRMGKDTKVMPGESFDIPVYVKLDENLDTSYITAMGFNLDYDKDAFEFEDIILTDPEQIDTDVLTQFMSKGFMLFESDNEEHIVIDPEKPFFTLRFKAGEETDGAFDIRLKSFIKDSDRFVHVIRDFDEDGMPSYYMPDIHDASVVVSNEQEIWLRGDANSDGKLDVRDSAYIARMLAQAKGTILPPWSDFNMDSKVNVRDAAMIARFLASRY